MNLYVLIDRAAGAVILPPNPLPEDWANINGLCFLPPSSISDLTWAGHAGMGFVLFDDPEVVALDPQGDVAALALARARLIRKDEIETEREMRMAAGVAVDFGTADALLTDGSTVPAGVRVLQTRPIPYADRSNLQTIMIVAQAYRLAGAGAEPMNPLICEDNAAVSVTADTAFAATSQVQTVLGTMIQNARRLKNEVSQAATVAAVTAIDISTGWS